MNPGKRKHFSSLSWQFGTLMSVILVLTMAGNALLEYISSTNQADEIVNARIESTGSLLTNIAVAPLLVYDFVTINDYLESVSMQDDIVFIQLSGKNDNIISQHINSPLPFQDPIDDKQANDDINILEVFGKKESVIIQNFPIEFEGVKLGGISLGIERRTYDEQAKTRLINNILLTLITALFSGFSIYLIFNHRILKPIQRIKTAAVKIAELDLTRKIEVEGHNELSELSISFNDMTQHLAETIEERNQAFDELMKLNETLEDRIHERTIELQQLNTKITHQAMHDPLTGLPNRSLIMENLKQSIHYAHRSKQQLAVFMLDLNRFKEVNDTLGHPVGDKLLKAVAERLPKTLRETDTFGRLGGDEFVIILSDADEEQALHVANKIQNEFSKDFPINGHPLSVGTSIGIGFYPTHSHDADTLIQRADIALYVAKKKENNIAIYDEAEDTHTLSRLMLVSQLKDAIENDQLTLHYQPQIDLVTRKVCGLEALCRWVHPEKGFISPDIFISMAEDSGLIKPLTDWVVESSIKQLSEWVKAGLNIQLSINLSVGNLLDPNLIERFTVLLEKYPLPPEILKFEITESIIMSDPDHVIQTLNDPIFKNVQFAIDDFGTGYSSLNHLKRLPVSEIKIDKSFIIDLAENSDDKMIVNSIIDLAENLGMGVVAEGIENEASDKVLQSLGCNIGQGYHYSKPIPAKAIPDTIKKLEARQAITDKAS